MNGEGYKDPTAEKAIKRAEKEKRPPKSILELVYVLKNVASLTGYDIIGRIHLRDRRSGEEWR